MRGFLDGDESIDALQGVYLDEKSGKRYTGDDLRMLREVAAAYPKERRTTVNTWDVHMILRNHPNRWELVKTPMDESQARALAMQAFITPNTVTPFSTIIDGNNRRPR